MKWSRGEHNGKVVTLIPIGRQQGPLKMGTFFLEMQTEQSTIIQHAQMKQMTWMS